MSSFLRSWTSRRETSSQSTDDVDVKDRPPSEKSSKKDDVDVIAAGEVNPELESGTLTLAEGAIHVLATLSM